MINQSIVELHSDCKPKLINQHLKQLSNGLCWYSDDNIKEKYVHAESNYSFGWSHGKEKMKGGIPDIAKGSYYANPIYDSITDDDKLKKEYLVIGVVPTNRIVVYHHADNFENILAEF